MAKGRTDVVVQMSNAFLVIAFKLNGSAAEAMAQIKARGYYTIMNCIIGKLPHE
jgi:hypothetical protein